MDISRSKYSIPKGAAKKLIEEEEASIIRSAQEKAIITGSTHSINSGQAGSRQAGKEEDSKVETPEPLI